MVFIPQKYSQPELDKYRISKEDIVFGTKWFKKHQKKILWLLNSPLTSNNTASANTDFNLSGNVADLTNYKTAQNTTSFRIYQLSV